MKEAHMIAPQAIVDQAINDLMRVLHEYAKTATIGISTQEELLAVIQTTLSASLNKALHETEMRQGVHHLDAATTTVADSEGKENSPENTGNLFDEVEEQLNDVMTITLEAAEGIMAEVERLLDLVQEMGGHLETVKKSIGEESVTTLVNNVATNVATFEGSLMQIMTALSFQDLTGQRLKKVASILGEMQDAFFGMYTSSGLMLKTSEEMAEENMEEIAKERKRRMDAILNANGPRLRGPTRGSNQADVDRLLDDLEQFR